VKKLPDAFGPRKEKRGGAIQQAAGGGGFRKGHSKTKTQPQRLHGRDWATGSKKPRGGKEQKRGFCGEYLRRMKEVQKGHFLETEKAKGGDKGADDKKNPQSTKKVLIQI